MLCDVAGAVGAAVAQQRRVAANVGSHGGIDADRAGQAVDQRAGRGNGRRARPGEQAGRGSAATGVGFGKGGDQAARGLVELALHGCRRRSSRKLIRPASLPLASVLPPVPAETGNVVDIDGVAGDAGAIGGDGVKLTERGIVSNSVVPSLVVMTMSLSPRVKVETRDVFRDLLQQRVALVERIRDIAAERVPEMTALLASWNWLSRELRSSPPWRSRRRSRCGSPGSPWCRRSASAPPVGGVDGVVGEVAGWTARSHRVCSACCRLPIAVDAETYALSTPLTARPSRSMPSVERALATPASTAR